MVEPKGDAFEAHRSDQTFYGNSEELAEAENASTSLSSIISETNIAAVS